MDTQFVQRKSLGHALVAAQSLDEGLALARSRVLQAPPAMCYEAIERREVS